MGDMTLIEWSNKIASIYLVLEENIKLGTSSGEWFITACYDGTNTTGRGPTLQSATENLIQRLDAAASVRRKELQDELNRLEAFK